MKKYYSFNEESNIQFEIDLRKWGFQIEFGLNFLTVNILCFDITFWFGDLCIVGLDETEGD